MKKKKGNMLWMRIVGAAAGATGFILLGVGGFYNKIIGLMLIGAGSMLIAGGS